MSAQSKTEEIFFPYSSPISLLEEFFFQYEWNYERTTEYEITAEAEGRWCNYQLFSLWRHDLECLIFSAMIDIKIPHDKRDAINMLLALFNPKVWMGHFEVIPTDEVPTYRYNLVLRGNPGVTLEQVEEILTAMVTECDRLYPALQFVLWGGKTPEDAVVAAMLDTCGEA